MQQAIWGMKHTGTERLPQIQHDSHFPDSFFPDSHFPDSIRCTDSQDGKTQVFPFFLYNLQEKQSYFGMIIVRGDI